MYYFCDSEILTWYGTILFNSKFSSIKIISVTEIIKDTWNQHHMNPVILGYVDLFQIRDSPKM